jgi:cation:H+ antiporter
MGISEGFVAATIVAIGTSLPELAPSIVAGVKRKSDIAIGNVVGSNLFNIFFVLGISSVVRPLSIAPELIISLIVGVVQRLFCLCVCLRG